MAESTQSTGQPGNAAQMPVLYKDPRPLDVENFGGYGLTASTSASFARTNTVPLAASEFQIAHMFFPIIFAGEDPPMPICVLGFDAQENLFLAKNGQWADETYVPAYVRRYPFILADVPGDDRKFLCAEFGADAVTNKNPAKPFFDNSGKITPVVEQALEFCRRFQDDVVLTRAFCAELKSHGLLKSTELRLTQADGSQRPFGTFISIEPSVLDGLPDAVFLDFRRRGLLPLIYMQLTSLQNWGRLNALRARSQGTTAANSR